MHLASVSNTIILSRFNNKRPSAILQTHNNHSRSTPAGLSFHNYINKVLGVSVQSVLEDEDEDDILLSLSYSSSYSSSGAVQ